MIRRCARARNFLNGRVENSARLDRGGAADDHFEFFGKATLTHSEAGADWLGPMACSKVTARNDRVAFLYLVNKFAPRLVGQNFGVAFLVGEPLEQLTWTVRLLLAHRSQVVAAQLEAVRLYSV